jgi:acyl-CoA thioester hydrolase
VKVDIKPYERLVEYYETDKMGIVHHANYLHWFEEARTDMMAQIGLDYNAIEKMGVMMPVLGIDCRYKKGAVYHQRVLVKTEIECFNGIKLRFAYTVTDRESGSLIVSGSSDHCFVNLDFKPVNVKKSYRDMFDTINQYLK